MPTVLSDESRQYIRQLIVEDTKKCILQQAAKTEQTVTEIMKFQAWAETSRNALIEFDSIDVTRSTDHFTAR
jgi:hypothetical protein